LENLLDDEDLDEATRLVVRDQLAALRDPDIGEAEQVERWERIKRLSPGLLESGRKVVESVITAAVKAQLGLP
jgi:hypothetical protein